MAHRIIRDVVVALATVCLACAAHPAEEELKQLSDGGITVSYPAGMETQAKRVLKIGTESIKPSVEVHRRMSALLSDANSVAKAIAELVGADEKTDEAQVRLQAYKDKSDALAQCFSHVRLVSRTAAAGAGGVDAGVLQVTYDAESGEFKTVLDERLDSPEKVKKSFFPVIVNADGSIASESKLVETALEFLGSGQGMVIAPIHDTVGYIIAQELEIYHPFSRWFNEGASAWITRRVVAAADPKLGDMANDLLSVSAKSKQLRDKVDLRAWAQTAFQNRNSRDYDPALESARTQYAVELLSEYLGSDGAKTLPKIIGEIKYSSNTNTDTICAAAEKVTGKDLKSALLGYVPKEMKDGIESGEAKELGLRAEALVQKKQWQEATETLRRALQMAPGDLNLRLNLACAQREIGERLDSEFQVFLLAALLKQGSQSFHLFEDTLEGRYVLARLAILVGNLQSAKAFLQPLLEQKPDHQDAKRAMEEIRALERAAKGTSG